MSAAMVDQRRKILKLCWTKRPKTIPQKAKLGSDNKLLKTSYLEFINFTLSGRKSQTKEMLAK